MDGSTKHAIEGIVIGRDYWDLRGGNGAYDELLAIFAKVGAGTRKNLGAA